MRFFGIMSIMFVSFNTAIAGRSGYLFNGQEVVVYENGKKVGEWPNEKNDSRKPNSIEMQYSRHQIRWDDDNFAKCYFVSGSNGEATFLNCIKK
jgi:hypothetical protein